MNFKLIENSRIWAQVLIRSLCFSEKHCLLKTSHMSILVFSSSELAPWICKWGVLLPASRFACPTLWPLVNLGEDCVSFLSRNNCPPKFYEFTEFTGEDGVPAWSLVSSNWLHLHVLPPLPILFISETTFYSFLCRAVLYRNHSVSNIEHLKRNLVKKQKMFPLFHCICFVAFSVADKNSRV